MHSPIFAALLILISAAAYAAEIPRELRVGRAGHAFDHVGPISAQAEAAAASGASIIYATGLGGIGYTGLPSAEELAAESKAVAEYNRRAKAAGIELSIGYLCATSIIKLDTFDKNWTNDFRAQFKTPPAEWRQQDRQGKPLASWYGGDYQPACMNNPDWRAYERAMVTEQLNTGHDGIFFDNPTVHPQGCYCSHCMEKFAAFLEQGGEAVVTAAATGDDRVQAIRKLTDAHPKEFLRFRATIARDFLADMRGHALTINPRALITCNNSLNSPGVFFSQCRDYGYDIHELSKVEDFVVVEDMGTQPRVEGNSQTVEYGPTFKQLHAISHGKPIVAVTLAGGDYHTAPNLMRLAMAEAAANSASYLSWPTWPEDQRKRMIVAVRPQADFLRRNEALLNDAPFRADVVLFLPFRRWVEADQCPASGLAAALSQANVQYSVVCEDDFDFALASKQRPVLLVESLDVLTPTEKTAVEIFERDGGKIIAGNTPDWLERVRQAVGEPSTIIDGPATVRAVVHDQPGRTIVHLFNLNIQRVSSFEDDVTPAMEVAMALTVPFKVRTVSLLTADRGATPTPLEFKSGKPTEGSLIQVGIPRIDISSIVVFEK